MYVPFNIIKELWQKEPDLQKAGIELDATDTHIAQIFGIDENKLFSVLGRHLCRALEAKVLVREVQKLSLIHI